VLFSICDVLPANKSISDNHDTHSLTKCMFIAYRKRINNLIRYLNITRLLNEALESITRMMILQEATYLDTFEIQHEI